MPKYTITRFRCDASGCDRDIEIRASSTDTPEEAAARNSSTGPFFKEVTLWSVGKQRVLATAWLCDPCREKLDAQLEECMRKFTEADIQF